MMTAETATATSITVDDRVIVRGRYLVYEKDPRRRFHARGVAFPVPYTSGDHRYYDDRDGWYAVLHQLRDASPYINTIRLYRLPIFAPPSLSIKNASLVMPSLDDDDDGDNDESNQLTIDPPSIAEFLRAAGELGFYVLLPLTSMAGAGVLDRSLAAPECYRPKLYQYGTKVVDAIITKVDDTKSGTYQIVPNVLGGVLGNEVMNSLLHWKAAPCILAFARDLKLYMHNKLDAGRSNNADDLEGRHLLPLVYATQHDGIGAAVTPTQNVQNTLQYLTCRHDDDDYKGIVGIDLYGINIESWCSSLQTFAKSEDGAVGTYWELSHDLINVTSVPIIFSEMGCSRDLFNRDNGLPPQNARDWKQIEVVEQDMNDLMSGFVAYAYDGPRAFRMTAGGPWDGRNVLPFDEDFYNFFNELNTTVVGSISSTTTISVKFKLSSTKRNCTFVTEMLSKCCGLDLFPVDEIPSYFEASFEHSSKSVQLNQQIQNRTMSIRLRQRRDPLRKRSKYYEDQESFNVVFSQHFQHPIRFPRSLATASLVLAAFVLRQRRRPSRQRQNYLTFPGNDNTARRPDYDTFS